jgi:hypothetical protein
MSEEELEPTGGEGEEYELMLRLEQLESLQEELDEVGCSSLNEVEKALVKPNISGDQRELLQDIRDQLLELQVNDLGEIRQEIDRLNQELDELE